MPPDISPVPMHFPTGGLRIKSPSMPSEFLKSYLRELKITFETINPLEFGAFVEELKGAHERQSHIFICGNGGSAATASHFVCDINKGASFGKEKRFKMVCLNDNIPIMLAYANDLSYEDVFVEQLKNFMKEDDLIIGISGSGNSKSIIKAVEYANTKGGRSFGVCGFGGGKLKDAAQKSIVINSSDMQKVEDLHMIVFHCVMQYFSKK